MRRLLSMVLILAMVGTSVGQAATYDEAVQALTEARRAQTAGKAAQEQQHLGQVLATSKDGLSRESLLLAIYAAHRLRRIDEIRDAEIAFVKAHRSDFGSEVDAHPTLSTDEKRVVNDLLAELASRVPFIEDLQLKSDVLFPYRGEPLSLDARLNAPAALAVALDGTTLARSPQSTREPSVAVAWRDRWADQTRLDFEVRADGDIASIQTRRAARTRLVLPEGLARSNGAYTIPGQTFQSETRTVRGRRIGWLIGGIILAGITVGVGSAPMDKAAGETTGSRVGGVAAAAVLTAGYFLLYAFHRKPAKDVADSGAIEHNRQLRSDLDARMRDVRVDVALAPDLDEVRLQEATAARALEVRSLREQIEKAVAEAEAIWTGMARPPASMDEWQAQQATLNLYQSRLADREALFRKLLDAGDASPSERNVSCEHRRARLSIWALA